ncbi:hypothetical protein PoB_000640100 [Plakobranchus ocellatus]|uniref:Uncharacterized protein n=1 Tax=Plakobranchus ocellatus TaxID=259542 RepID=A0AAV3XY64_9GAST|nr:hypothetical protein PoB_000640100 [Plakobranchus ocellatus]
MGQTTGQGPNNPKWTEASDLTCCCGQTDDLSNYIGRQKLAPKLESMSVFSPQSRETTEFDKRKATADFFLSQSLSLRWQLQTTNNCMMNTDHNKTLRCWVHTIPQSESPYITE